VSEIPIQSLIDLHMAGEDKALLRLCQDMDQQAQWHPYQAVMMAEAAARLDDRPALARGLELIIAFRDLSPEACAIMQEFVRSLAMARVLDAFGQQQYALVLRYLEFIRLLDPALAEAFAPPSTMPIPRPLGLDSDEGISGRLPPYAQMLEGAGGIPPARRVLIFMRRFYFGPDSREHEVFARFDRGFQAAAWQVRSIDPSFGPDDADGRPMALAPTGTILVDHALAMEADVVIIDFWGIAFAPGALVDFLVQIRRIRPQIKLVAIHLDPWMKNSWAMTMSLAPMIDLFWCHSPRTPLWQAPDFADKLFFQPFPMGVRPDPSPSPPLPISLFLGAVVHYNPTRAFWLSALHESGAAFTQQLSSHGLDGLDAEASFRTYLNKLAGAGRAINFSMRENGFRQMTARVFESFWVGTCLIQEQSDEVEDYFTPGLHYLCFRTLPELLDILTTVAKTPGIAARIAACGHQFYMDRYADPILVAKLDRQLFPA